LLVLSFINSGCYFFWLLLLGLFNNLLLLLLDKFSMLLIILLNYLDCVFKFFGIMLLSVDVLSLDEVVNFFNGSSSHYFNLIRLLDSYFLVRDVFLLLLICDWKPLSLSLVLNPLASLDCAIRKDVDSNFVLLAKSPVSNVGAAISPDVDSEAVFLIILILTMV
jgi:hypothetical protein